MTTLQDNTTLRGSMSNDAYELIQCFYDGVDVVVRELAQEIAEERGSFLKDDPNVIAIEVEDVREAGRRVVGSLRDLLKNKKLPAELEQSISQMGECFSQQHG